MDQLELQKRLPIVRQALRVAQSNSRERGRLIGLCIPKKVRNRVFNSFHMTNQLFSLGYWMYFANL